MGLSTSNWTISPRFFSPPEKPSLIERDAKLGSISRRSKAAAISFGQVRTFGATPSRAAFAVRKKLLVETPGTSIGYCMARKSPALARSSTVSPVSSTPSSVADPEVMWYLG